MSERVVVTGMGAITPIGLDVKSFWASLKAGVSGISDIQRVNTDAYKIKRAFQIKSFDEDRFAQKPVLNELGRTSQFCFLATEMALEDAGIGENRPVKDEPIGFSIGSGLSEAAEYELICDRIRDGRFLGDKNIRGAHCLQPSEIQIATIMDYFKLWGEAMLFSCACAAGSFAIAHAYQQIKNGLYNLMVAVGTDAFTIGGLTYQNRLQFKPAHDCTPFDKNRKGLMIGEGSGALILEARRHAIERNATIYGEILGFGLSCDAYHITQIQLSGITKAIDNAIKNAGVLPSDIQYICAHGTGTVLNDKTETAAIKNVFGSAAFDIPISSIKSMIGHTAGASGSLGAIATLMAINDGQIPPTINFKERDPDCDLDYVPNTSRKAEIDIAQVNAFGFGGNNCSLVFKKESLLERWRTVP